MPSFMCFTHIFHPTFGAKVHISLQFSSNRKGKTSHFRVFSLKTADFGGHSAPKPDFRTDKPSPQQKT